MRKPKPTRLPNRVAVGKTHGVIREGKFFPNNTQPRIRRKTWFTGITAGLVGVGLASAPIVQENLHVQRQGIALIENSRQIKKEHAERKEQIERFKQIFKLKLRPMALQESMFKAATVFFAEQHGVNPRLALALGHAESAWNWTAESRTGAQGLFQILASTDKILVGKGLRKWIRKTNGKGLVEPLYNIEGGIAFFAELQRQTKAEHPEWTQTQVENQALQEYNQGQDRLKTKKGQIKAKEFVKLVRGKLEKYYLKINPRDLFVEFEEILDRCRGFPKHK
ncbi:MAG: transglycosylase SLT domain-containing protein [Candidatus Diapherotrites archaeon]|nr:transglycosylase SLT domain-containing protein [Candidatus Diapherotrites archaeon]